MCELLGIYNDERSMPVFINAQGMRMVRVNIFYSSRNNVFFFTVTIAVTSPCFDEISAVIND